MLLYLVLLVRFLAVLTKSTDVYHTLSLPVARAYIGLHICIIEYTNKVFLSFVYTPFFTLSGPY